MNLHTSHGDNIHNDIRHYYGDVLQSSRDLKTGACCPAEAMPPALRTLLEDVHPEVKDRFYGCGSPLPPALEGRTVLDLGCGTGRDVYLLSRLVGESGRVIGVDMTPEMIHKARENAAKGKIKNIDFRLGEIEHLPVADGIADVILSNCVINLSPDKPQVYAEAARVLKPGGRLAISDVVAVAPIPPRVKSKLQAHSGCIAGSATVSETERMLKQAGFFKIRICVNERSKEFIKDWFPGSGAESYVRSATIEACKQG